MFIKNYGLCTSHYLSAPALSWDAMNLLLLIALELISDADIYLFLEKVWETDFPKRYRETNNNYLKSYDPKQKLKCIIYINANNLHGYTMSKFLPTSGFRA